MNVGLKALVVGLAWLGASAAFAAGDADKGKSAFRQCQSCHKIGEGARNRTGPQLNEVVGRAAGSADGFRYSTAMKKASEAGLVWTSETLDAFLVDPRRFLKGTKMSFRGVKDAQTRADLIAFLQSFSGEAEAALDLAILAIEGDPEYGEYLSNECTTCHQVSGSDAGIPSITGWPTEDFVVALHHYRDGSRKHPVMEMIAGRLSNEEIAALAAYFVTLEGPN